MAFEKDILDKIVSFNGIFERVFGSYLPDLAEDKEIGYTYHILKNVFGLKDIDRLIKNRAKFDNIKDLSKIIFRFYEENQNQSIFNPLKK